jgi:hypothetical protein
MQVSPRLLNIFRNCGRRKTIAGRSLISALLLFTYIFVSNFRMLGDLALKQLPAVVVIQITEAALAARASECIGLAVDAGVALLHTPVVPAAYQFAGARKDSGADWDAAFSTADMGFVECNGKHLFA